jgi:hypothetical protein
MSQLRNLDLVFFVCYKADHFLQLVVLSNKVGPKLFLFILYSWALLVLRKSRYYALQFSIWYCWCCCFLILREVFILLLLEPSGHQYQEWIKNPQRHFSISFLGDTQMLLHIIQGLKASMYAKRGLKLISHWRYYSYGHFAPSNTFIVWAFTYEYILDYCKSQKCSEIYADCNFKIFWSVFYFVLSLSEFDKDYVH